MVKKYVSLKEALQKIKAFCAYQERCHSEVKGKLFDYGLSINEVDEIVAVLIEDNYFKRRKICNYVCRGQVQN